MGDEASGTMASYVVGAAVFMIGATFLFNFALETPKVAGLEHAQAGSTANNILDLLLGTPGYPNGWNASALSTAHIQRLGLLEAGSSVRLDAEKFIALAQGSYYNPNTTDTYVDYHEAKASLGLTDHDFHLRVFPSAPLATAENYGITNMDDFAVAYIGNWSGTATAGPDAKAEQYVLDQLHVGFVNQTRVGGLTSGSVFPDDSTHLRSELVPLLGTGVQQAVISAGASPKYDFMRVGPTALETAMPLQAGSGFTSALALADSTGTTLSYTKSRELRALLGVANFSGLNTVGVAWQEYVDTNFDSSSNTRDDGDYGYLEVSPDGGATWYAITNSALERSQDSPSSPFLPEGLWKTRTTSISALNCAACSGASDVYVALHWVADGDTKQGYGWMVDNLTMTAAGFSKTFETPEFEMLIVGSNVDQAALTATEVKNGIRDFVEVYGGRLIVLGGNNNVNWLQPLFNVGIREASTGVATPDTTHPLLTVPNELAYSSYETNGMVWDFSASADEDLFQMVIGSTAGHEMALSAADAFGQEGAIILTTYLPHLMSAEERSRFFANAITYGRYHQMYIDFGPDVPDGIEIATATRSATMDKSRDGSGDYVDLSFVLYVWPGNLTSAGSAAAIRSPFEPESLSATPGNKSVTLAWAPPGYTGTSAILSYNVYRGTAPGLTTFLETVTSTSLVDDQLINGVTYYYNVTAVNLDGYQGYSSRAVNATPVAEPYPPAAPSVTGGAGQFVITWNAPIETGGAAITNYTLWASDNGATPTFEVDVGLNASWTHMDAVSIEPGDTWTFKVRATSSNGTGGWSQPTSGSSLLTAPSLTTLVAVGHLNHTNLSWVVEPGVVSSYGITGFTLFRSAGGGAYSQLASITGTNSTYDDRNVVGGTYSYVLQLVNSAGAGPNSNEATAVVASFPTEPIVLATPWYGSLGAVALTLNSTGTTATNYHVYRAPTGNTPVLVHNITANGTLTFWNDTGLTSLSAYDYQIASVGPGGVSSLSPKVTTVSSGVPGQAVLVVTSAAGQVGLSWTPDGSGITNYTINRGSSALSLSAIATIGTNTSFSDFTGTSGVVYYYSVTATNPLGSGSESNVVAGTNIGAPLPPTVVATTGSGAGVVRLTITAPGQTNGAAITAYNVTRTIGGTPTSFNVTYSGTPQTYDDATGQAGVTVTYTVKAINLAGSSEASAPSVAVSGLF